MNCLDRRSDTFPKVPVHAPAQLPTSFGRRYRPCSLKNVPLRPGLTQKSLVQAQAMGIEASLGYWAVLGHPSRERHHRFAVILAAARQ